MSGNDWQQVLAGRLPVTALHRRAFNVIEPNDVLTTVARYGA